MTSLEHRREYIISKTALDITRRKFYPIKQYLSDDIIYTNFTQKTPSTGPSEIFIGLQHFIFSENIKQQHNRMCPPWRLEPAIINNSLSKFKKDHTSSAVYHQLFAEIIHQYEGYTIFYTDGSKCDQLVGCAFVDLINIVTNNFHLPSN